MDPGTKVVLEAAAQLLTQGVLGILVVVLGWALYKKDKAITDQSENFHDALMGVQREVITTATKMVESTEAIERKTEELDRRERALKDREHEIERRERDVEQREREQPRRPIVR